MQCTVVHKRCPGRLHTHCHARPNSLRSPGVVKLELTSENDLFFHYT